MQLIQVVQPICVLYSDRNPANSKPHRPSLAAQVTSLADYSPVPDSSPATVPTNQ